MKEKYEPPVMEIVDIDKEDIIFASEGFGGEEEEGPPDPCAGVPGQAEN